MGLDVYLYSRAEQESDSTHGDVVSEKYPEHLFNRRYLRSSYNGGGYNRAVPDFLADPDRPAAYGSLDWIFEPVRVEPDEYETELTEALIPALEQAKARAIEAAEITAEFCDEAIMLIRRDGSAFMHWSG